MAALEIGHAEAGDQPLHDGCPEQVRNDHRGHRFVRIDRAIPGGFLLRREIVHVHALVVDAHKLKSRQHFATVDGDRVRIYFHP